MADDIAILKKTTEAVRDTLVAAEKTGVVKAGVPWAILPFTPVASWADWELLLTDPDLHVDVVPVGFPQFQLASRGHVEYVTEVDVGVRKKLEQSDRDEGFDGRVDWDAPNLYALLIEQIAEFFAADRFADNTDIVWQQTDIRAAWIAEHMRQGQFTGIVRLQFDVTKPPEDANS